MSIFPLPVFEADGDPVHRTEMSDEEIYQRLEPPKTIVVRFGAMKLIGEYPYDGEAKPGCGSQLVVRTHRGTELATMLTTTCSNAGCAKSVTRNEMLDYIENSGGNEFPFHDDGRVLRVATIEDLNQQAELNSRRPEYTRQCNELIKELDLDMKLVEVEPILGFELLTFYFLAKQRVDFRELVRRLASTFKTRIEMRQVGARDEARLVADYERCGQHCCCKNFLKVLKPVSMKSAKVQKATLDPLKISGRCGRLMCCLRYEDATYAELRKKLPKRRSRVGTAFGPGTVVDTKLLVQLALIKLEHNDEEVAVPIEELMNPDECPQPGSAEFEAQRRAAEEAADPMRGMDAEAATDAGDDRKRKRGRGRRRSKSQQQDAYREKSESTDGSGQPQASDEDSTGGKRSGRKKKRRRGRRGRRRRGRGKGGGENKSGDG